MGQIAGIGLNESELGNKWLGGSQMKVKIVTDSTAYIDPDVLKRLDITVVSLYINFPDETFKETEVDHEYFYEKIAREGIIPTSSQPSGGEFHKAFSNILENDYDIVGIFISSELSGTFASAVVARQMIATEDDQERIELIDSRTTCMALGLAVIAAAQAARDGKDINDVRAAAWSVLNRVRFYFVLATLEYLQKGGRIGGAAALLGSILQIKPVLHLKDGKVEVFERARGSKASVERVLGLLEDDCHKFGLEKVVLHHVLCEDKVQDMAMLIRGRYGVEVTLHPIGPVIGLHVGPGAFGIIYVTKC
jgi:DegV family protein with EDD domain